MLATAKKSDTRYGSLAAREEAASRFIPYTRHVDETTLKTKDGYLLKVIKIEGLPFETADQIDINHRKNIRAQVEVNTSCRAFRKLVPESKSALCA